MGNCLFKPKSNYCERLETEIFYLQKENLRSYDLFLRELKSLKSSVQKLELPISSTLNEPQKITYVWTVLRVLITILTDYLFILSSDLSVYPIIIPTYYVIYHQSVNSIIIFTDYLFILSSDLPINKNTKKISNYIYCSKGQFKNCCWQMQFDSSQIRFLSDNSS